MSYKKIIALAVIILFVVSCSLVDKQEKNLSNPMAIPSQGFTIKAGVDTVIRTVQGIEFFIPQGAFDTDVTVEVKEALTPNDVIKYGLSTSSNGKPLQSAGMFFIDAKDSNGKQAKLNKPIAANIPADNMLSNPQLFKGEIDSAGNISWVNPTDINNKNKFSGIDLGEKLFKQNCASCHYIDFDIKNTDVISYESSKELNKHSGDDSGHYGEENSTYESSELGRLIGPSLLYINKRRTFDWFKKYTKNPPEFMKTGDQCANCLAQTYYKSGIMPAQNLSDNELELLWKYIIKESNKSDKGADVISLLDCKVVTTTTTYELKKSDSKFNWNKERVIRQAADTLPPTKAAFERKPDNNQAFVYSINIPTLGWHNIDEFINQAANSLETDIDIEVEDAGSFSTVNVVLVFKRSFTTVKLYEVKSGHFGFQEKTYLPSEKIGVYALAERDGKLYYALQNASTFVSTGKLNINAKVKLVEATRNQIEQELDKNFDTKPKVVENIVPCYPGIVRDTVK